MRKGPGVLAVPPPAGRRHRPAESVRRSVPRPLFNAAVSGAAAWWPARLKFSRPTAERPATSHATVRTGRVRRRAANANPPSWRTSVCSGTSVTTRPNAHDHSDGYPLRASGRYPLMVEAALSTAAAHAATCRVMWMIRGLRIRPPYEAIQLLASAGYAATAEQGWLHPVTGLEVCRRPVPDRRIGGVAHA